jgi:L-threonylcarbamoyladenylate synthase
MMDTQKLHYNLSIIPTFHYSSQSMEKEILNAIEVLRNGGLILYPTDTIWGIGCDATNEKAVERIFNLKKRDEKKSMIVLLDNEMKLQSYVREVPEVAYDLIEYAENPLTVIYDHAKNLAANVLAEDGSIGIRITKDIFCKKLVERFRKPIVSTSANISGENSPSNFSEISEEVKRGVDYIVALRQEEYSKNLPSTIIRLKTNGEIKFIRR